MEVDLIVPVNWLKLKIAGRQQRQECVDPAPPRADGQRETPGERPIEEKRSIQKIHLHETVWRVAARAATVDVDDAAETTSKLGAVAARREAERLDHFSVEGRAKPAEMIKRRDGDSVDEGAGVLRRRAPHGKKAPAKGGPRHARQILNRL